MDSNKSLRSQSKADRAELGDYIKTILYFAILVIVILFLVWLESEYTTNFVNTL